MEGVQVPLQMNRRKQPLNRRASIQGAHDDQHRVRTGLHLLHQQETPGPSLTYSSGGWRSSISDPVLPASCSVFRSLCSVQSGKQCARLSVRREEKL